MNFLSTDFFLLVADWVSTPGLECGKLVYHFCRVMYQDFIIAVLQITRRCGESLAIDSYSTRERASPVRSRSSIREVRKAVFIPSGEVTLRLCTAYIYLGNMKKGFVGPAESGEELSLKYFTMQMPLLLNYK
jgi:hypothetical protein